MRRRALAMIAAAAVACVPGLAAQQPGEPGGRGQHGARHGSDSAGVRMHAMMQQHMRQMDSLDLRLDSLVERMNRSSGSRKQDAMAAVITELVAQRRAMHAHHREMMREHGPQHGRGDRPR